MAVEEIQSGRNGMRSQSLGKCFRSTEIPAFGVIRITRKRYKSCGWKVRAGHTASHHIQVFDIARVGRISDVDELGKTQRLPAGIWNGGPGMKVVADVSNRKGVQRLRVNCPCVVYHLVQIDPMRSQNRRKDVIGKSFTRLVVIVLVAAYKHALLIIQCVVQPRRDLVVKRRLCR